jgi:4-amino-4-deoxy-L-arabinose transferase-like glycosyltransferase
VALSLWCFCPNVIANGQLILPDMGTTACGVWAGFCFWRWLQEPTWLRAVGCGIVLGLAELAKTNWLVLFVLWPAVWLHWRQLSPGARRSELGREWAQLGAMLLACLYVINAAYGFEVRRGHQ